MRFVPSVSQGRRPPAGLEGALGAGRPRAPGGGGRALHLVRCAPRASAPTGRGEAEDEEVGPQRQRAACAPLRAGRLPLGTSERRGLGARAPRPMAASEAAPPVPWERIPRRGARRPRREPCPRLRLHGRSEGARRGDGTRPGREPGGRGPRVPWTSLRRPCFLPFLWVVSSRARGGPEEIQLGRAWLWGVRGASRSVLSIWEAPWGRLTTQPRGIVWLRARGAPGPEGRVAGGPGRPHGVDSEPASARPGPPARTVIVSRSVLQTRR